MQAILDAAAELFADEGFENTTMEAIASRAGTSIGSVYQFFEKKQDVFVALAHQVLQEVRVLAAQLTGAGAMQMAWPELIDASVDAFVALGRAHPGLRAINANLQLYGLFEEADEAQSRELIAQAARVLPTHIPTLSEHEARRVATMIITTINAALFFTRRSTDEEAAELLADSKRMLRAYVSTYV